MLDGDPDAPLAQNQYFLMINYSTMIKGAKYHIIYYILYILYFIYIHIHIHMWFNPPRVTQNSLPFQLSHAGWSPAWLSPGSLSGCRPTGKLPPEADAGDWMVGWLDGWMVFCSFFWKNRDLWDVFWGYSIFWVGHVFGIPGDVPSPAHCSTPLCVRVCNNHCRDHHWHSTCPLAAFAVGRIFWNSSG